MDEPTGYHMVTEIHLISTKSAAQAIPTYAMSVFQIPKKICKGITDAISRFWWGDDATHKRMHWFAW